jgi:hypothetical protein
VSHNKDRFSNYNAIELLTTSNMALLPSVWQNIRFQNPMVAFSSLRPLPAPAATGWVFPVADLDKKKKRLKQIFRKVFSGMSNREMGS